MPSLTRLLASGLLACALPFAASQAAGFPDHAIRFIVPWNAGGSNDIAARELQQLLSADHITLVVENQPGATGAIGLAKVAASPPDGYVLGMGTSSTLAQIAQNLTPLRNEQFTHIARVSTDPLMLLVPANGPARNLDEFLALMKKNPGKISIGTPGTNNLNHIFAEMTARSAGVGYVNVPYTGGSRVITDLAGKQIDAAVLKPSESKAQIDAGFVRPIGIFANARLALYPDVPTFKEKGYDVFPYGPLVQMAYVVAPAGLPAPVRQRLVDAFRKAIQSQKYKDFAAQNGFLVDDLAGDALDKEVRDVQTTLNSVAAKVFKH
ncbi:ABC transporter substrate-binding protein [Bordetella genomosp. 10]|uniref:ABC transporter substrate-binding protein n=1 Tax=Bordetella genomosp. 10 TaxID=1416804 RepID=A0A261S5G0_9BORD|nr:tripartite tricarboxylate transporter substrate binding protein [Bordetella genomosp. 10]OZI32217.1 ABC transporter substrate-binding protein [Bordetella genomosp. 10]